MIIYFTVFCTPVPQVVEALVEVQCVLGLLLS